MKKKGSPLVAGILMVVAMIGGTVGCCSEKQQFSSTETKGSVELTAEEIKVKSFSNGISCHDPQILVGQDGFYYMVGSHMVGAKSTDLQTWECFANGNNLFSDLFDGDMPAFSYVGKNEEGGYSVWAPDISYNETMGKYVMYFCTTSSYIKSNICMAVADEPQGPYSYVNTLLYSGYGESDVDQTNLYEVLGKDADVNRYLKYGGYNNDDWPNCIDPSSFTDENGKLWLVYGSWSGGIFLLELDKATGYPIFPEADEQKGVDPYYGIRLAGGGHHSVEGPFIQYNEENGYYYLFLSYGELTREGGYQIRQFRSENVEGPYVDAAGNTLEDQDDYFNYGLKMIGNYMFPSLNKAYMAPGGQSVFKDIDGNYYITYHQRFDGGSEYHEPRVHRMMLNSEDWFMVVPFETSELTVRDGGYTADDIRGNFYVVNHSIDISSKIRDAVVYTFAENGTIMGGEENGTYKVSEGTNDVVITLGEKLFSGKIIDSQDEAGNNVRCIIAVGTSNETIWAVQYRK